MAKEMIYDKKEARLKLVEEYLTKPLQPEPDQPTLIRDILTNHKVTTAQDISTIIRYLDQLQDAKSGIIWHDQIPGFLIRDARNAQKCTDGTESFEKQYLNATRAALEIVDQDRELLPNVKENAKRLLFKRANAFIQEFYKIQGQSPKELQKLTFGHISELTNILQNARVTNPTHKLNIAKNYQNFNDIHNDFATIKNIEVNGNTHTIIESEVGLRKLTTEQANEYKDMASSKWFNALEPFEQDLVRKYKPQITSGSHTIPTELRRIPGIRNAFLKTTAIYKDNNVIAVADSLHAGNVVSSSKAKESRQSLTDQNLEQIREHFPENTILNVNTLTTAFKSDESIINHQLNNRTDKKNVTFTNTPFNKFRISNYFNTHQPIEDRVKKVADILDNDQKAIKNYLTEPTGFIRRWLFKAVTFFFRESTSFEKAKTAINVLKDNDIKQMLLTAIELKQNLNNANNLLGRWSSIFKSNINLLITENMNKLDNQITAINSGPPAITEVEPLLTNDSVGIASNNKGIRNVINLIACKSGIDRTGYAEHYISAKAIADRLDCAVTNVIEELSYGNHTASITGTSFAGGASVGADGIKPSTKDSMPESFIEPSKHLMRYSAAGNKFTEGRMKKGAKALENYKREEKSAQNTIENPTGQDLSSSRWRDKVEAKSNDPTPTRP